MQISTVCGYLDWIHFVGVAGENSLERAFDWMTIARIRKVYWRAMEGGRAAYPSRVAHVLRGRDLNGMMGRGDGGGPDSRRYLKHVDCNAFDPLATAVRIGHERGIEVHAWFTFCEEDHGGHLGSRFGQRPDLRKHDRHGKDYPGTIEFFYPEVQEYKLRILDELLARGIDGVLLDFARHNATPNGDASGVHRFGYNPEIRAAFRKSDGRDPFDLPADDPHWLAFKAGYISRFIRRFRTRLGKKPLAMMTIPHVDNPRWLCLDLPALTADGTLDLVMPFGFRYDHSPARVSEEFAQLRRQVRGRRARVTAGVQAYWHLDPEAFEGAVAAAEEAGAKELVLYEGVHLTDQKLITSVRATHLKAPRRRREVEVRRLNRAPAPRDWATAPRQRGFFLLAGKDQEKPTAATSFSVLAGPTALHVRLVADGEQGQVDPTILESKKPYIDWLGIRLYWLGADRAHLFLDPGATRRDFRQFRIDRSGQVLQGTRQDNDWSAPWTGQAVPAGSRRWEATWTIPYKSLQRRRPRQGERWGFQVVREQAATKETACWFVQTGYGIDPAQWGDLVFA